MPVQSEELQGTQFSTIRSHKTPTDQIAVSEKLGAQSHSQTSYPGQHLPVAGALPFFQSQSWSPCSSGAEFENYSYISSPASSVVSHNYNPSSLSPRAWSVENSPWNIPPGLSSQRKAETQHLYDPYAGTRPSSSYPNEAAPTYPAMLPNPYEPGVWSSRINFDHPSPNIMSAASLTSRSVSPQQLSPPGGTVKHEDELDSGADFQSSEPPLTPESVHPSRDAAVSKSEVSYAQLIFQAFLSVPSHSMTLQEIYEWFKDNTSKPETSEGWKNSVRHNLSMNKAFVKKEKKKDEDGSSVSKPGEDTLADTPSVPTKKSTVWVLQDWAVTQGVQSTTRYRPKGGSSARAARSTKRTQQNVTYRPHHQRPHQCVPSRALAGQKGGWVTSRTKSLLRNRHGGSFVASSDDSLPSFDASYYPPHLVGGAGPMLGNEQGQGPPPYGVPAHHHHHHGQHVALGEGGMPVHEGSIPEVLPLTPEMEETPQPTLEALQQQLQHAQAANPPYHDLSQYTITDVEAVYPEGELFDSGKPSVFDWWAGHVRDET